MGIPYHHPGAMHHWQMPAVPLTKEQETQILDEQVKMLKQNLEAIEKRLAELKE